VISTDARRQQSMPPQAPLSDAYIAGMPAKRRKVPYLFFFFLSPDLNSAW
jgi:hypothetical protein